MAKKNGQITETKGKFKPELLKQLAGFSVVVGLPSDKIHEPSGKPLSELGAIHEFGMPGGGFNGSDIPKRSFLRGFINKDKAMIKDNLRAIPVKVLQGADANMAMDALAQWAAGRSRLFFVEGNNWPPNSPVTIKLKNGKDTPLINTGELRQSIIGIALKS